jgi:hypothetical protein
MEMRAFPILSLLILLSLYPSIGSGQMKSPMENLILTEKEAIAILPPEVVSGPMVSRALWSSDGRYLLVVREDMQLTPQLLRKALNTSTEGRSPVPPPGLTRVILWDTRTRRADEVWKMPMFVNQLEDLQWLPGTDQALALVRQTPLPTPQNPTPKTSYGLLRINGATGRSQLFNLSDEQSTEQWITLSVSPAYPVAILRQMSMNVSPEEQQVIFYQLREGRRVGAGISGRRDMVGSQIVWSADGAQPYLRVASPSRDKKLVESFYALDFRAGQLKKLESAPRLYAYSQPEQPLRLKTSAQILKEGDIQKPVTSLWLESNVKSEFPRALVCADSSQGWLSPRGDHILYISQGAAFVTSLFNFSKEEFEQARNAARRAMAVSNAKQIGLAALMYAQDHDENLPSGDVQSLLTPYVKNTSIFEGLVYTHGGGPLSAIERPAETELGYVRGPGGRAIIYADGHVKWKND